MKINLKFLIIALITLTVICVAISVCLYVYLKEGITIVLTEEEIRAGVAKRFPIEKTHLLILKIVYSDPIIEILESKNRIRIGVTATPKIEINDKTYSGSALVNGGFKFNPSEGSFYLTGFTVETLKLNESKGLKLDKVSNALSDSLEEIFKKHPVYVLPDSDLKHKIIKMVVKDIKVINKSIIITLGL